MVITAKEDTVKYLITQFSIINLYQERIRIEAKVVGIAVEGREERLK